MVEVEEKCVQALEFITAIKCSFLKCVNYEAEIWPAQYAQALLEIMLCHVGGEERELPDTIYFEKSYLTPVQQLPLDQPGTDARHAFIPLPILVDG